LLWAWLMLFPTCLPLPQSSHFLDMVGLLIYTHFTKISKMSRKSNIKNRSAQEYFLL
jgi:hypothetical protein